MANWRVRTRLTISFLALSLLSLLLFGSYILWFFHQHSMNAATEDLFVQTQVVKQLLREKMNGPIEKATIDPELKELGINNNLHITIADENGLVIADSLANPLEIENAIADPEFNTALSGDKRTFIRYNQKTGENWLYAAAPYYRDKELIGAVRVGTTLSGIENGYQKIQFALLIAFLFASFLAFILSIRLGRKYTAQLDEITEVAHDIGAGKLDRRVHMRTEGELDLLAHTLNTLASNLEDKIEEMKAETSKLELILSHMDNAVILLDRYGRVTAANKMANDSFSITPEMLGQHNLQVIGNSYLDRAVREAIANSEGRLIDLKTRLQGNKRVFQVYLAPITGSHGEVTGLLSVFHDITALQQVQEKQSEFIANASHELATPLTAIKGFAETLLDGALDDPTLNTKFITVIHSEAERMQRLVADLLTMAKLDSQEYRRAIILQPTIFAPLIDSVVQELSPEWQAKNIRIAITGKDASLSALASPDWLKQLLINLIDNAIKYTPAGGKIFIYTWRQNDRAYLAVQDSGIGIPKEDLPLIFDRFYRVDRARARSAGGTGLGLAIVKFIIESLGGTITATSEIDIGTTFTISLPLASEKTTGQRLRQK